MNTKNQEGKVTVVNATASIQQMLNAIAPNGTVYCQMQTSDNDAQFTFTNNGIEATFRIQKGGAR